LLSQRLTDTRAEPTNSAAAVEQIPAWGERLIAAVFEIRQVLEETVAELESLRGKAKPIPKGFITAKAATGIVSFEYEMIRLWARNGVIKAEKRGGRWWVHRKSLEAFAALTPAERGARMRAMPAE